MVQTILFVTFFACPKKVTKKRTPTKPARLRHSRPTGGHPGGQAGITSLLSDGSLIKL